MLPDHIANQIAAGEVIQRPASAVKELLENAIDAGADEVRLIVKEAGKSLVQVIDNGKGMSETDARMAFERHATSKIKQIEDLFQIRTMGFRGEALASIAAVAQVELKTKRREDAAGTYIEVENSKLILQEPAGIPDGTSIAMKNLFFNVPARRNFLKSNASELKHIVEEFIRVALANPQVFLSFVSNGQELYHLEKGSLKQRISQLFGNNFSTRLVSVQENTDYLNINGFVGKPETARKTRGDQYFFVNNRYIKSPYLHHAVMRAFEQLIPADSFPMYVLFIDLDPARLDINVHPTKQEIKFEDEKIVYAFMQSAVKHALAQFSITPTLDFDLDPSIEKLDAVQKPVTADRESAAVSSSLFKTFSQRNQAHLIESEGELKHWKSFFESPQPTGTVSQSDIKLPFKHPVEQDAIDFESLMQISDAYILVSRGKGFFILQQQNAHESVLYHRFRSAHGENRIPSQRSMFPVVIELNPADALLVGELIPDLLLLGYQLEEFGKNSFALQAIPADLKEGNEKSILESMLEQFKHFSNDIKLTSREKLWRSLAFQQSVRAGKKLELQEMRSLVAAFLEAGMPTQSPSGRANFLSYTSAELDKYFGR